MSTTNFTFVVFVYLNMLGHTQDMNCSTSNGLRMSWMQATFQVSGQVSGRTGIYICDSHLIKLMMYEHHGKANSGV